MKYKYASARALSAVARGRMRSSLRPWTIAAVASHRRRSNFALAEGAERYRHRTNIFTRMFRNRKFRQNIAKRISVKRLKRAQAYTIGNLYGGPALGRNIRSFL
jgi:hypothetical protein